ncbi:MAG: 30S ribosomal protein S2 [Fibrobacteraceae bacterium]|nr:30S ribosomal protein S2 [Fibrobacteraceae bacterium]
MATLPSVEDLLAAGAHFGHQAQRWNPKMKPYILAKKNDIYVLNLDKTIKLLEAAGDAAARVSAGGKYVLFVGTKPTARAVVEEAAKKTNHFFVSNRWLGGMLTNFQTVRKSIKQIDKIDQMEADGLFKELSKKEVLDKSRIREKMLGVFGGIREMATLPGLVVVTDLHHEHIAVAEARRLNIPIIGICDTNVDPTLVDFPVPANDDAVKSIKIIVDYIADCLTFRSNVAKTADAETAKKFDDGDAEKAASRKRTFKPRAKAEKSEAKAEEK